MACQPGSHLPYAPNVEGVGVGLLSLLCCVVGMVAVLGLLGVLAVNMRDEEPR